MNDAMTASFIVISLTQTAALACGSTALYIFVGSFHPQGEKNKMIHRSSSRGEAFALVLEASQCEGRQMLRPYCNDSLPIDAHRPLPLEPPARAVRRVALVALVHRHAPEVARLDHDV